MNALSVAARCLVLAISAVQAVPLPRSSPEAQGVSSAAVRGFIEEADRRVDTMHSFMLVRHGQVVAEAWWAPESAERPHVLYSLSKSFTSTAVGLAVAEGRLNIDDPVLKFFPDDAPAEPSANLKAMRVRDLLTMTTGHQSEPRLIPDQTWVRSFLAQPVEHDPGTHFLYNSAGTYMCSAIVQQLSGQTLLAYLQPRLFAPLGIEGAQWSTSPEGVSAGGWGLFLKTEDIAKFGQLYLQKGQWRGQQIIPAAWVEQATARQVSNGSDPAGDWDQGYGFQFWRCRHGAYRGDGAFGQYCIVLPEQDAVVVMTADAKDMPGQLRIVWEKLLTAFHPAALPENAVEQEKLKAAAAGLKVRAGHEPNFIRLPGTGSEPVKQNAVLQAYVDRKTLAGAVALVADKDKVLAIEGAGFADIAGAKPMREDTRFWIASQTKPMTAVAVMMLVDEGKLSLDDPVEKYLPEFRAVRVLEEQGEARTVLRKPARPPTLRDVLSHMSGMTFTSDVEKPTLDALPLEPAVRSYAMTPLVADPGVRCTYSNTGINTAARVLEVITGMSYADFIQRRLFDPLGMKDTTFHLTPDQEARVAKCYKPGPDNAGLAETRIGYLLYPLSDRVRRHPMPAGGLFSTARDTARFCQMMLHGGQLDGKRVLSEAAVREMTRRQTPESVKESFGIGFAVDGESYGHGGAQGTHMEVRGGLVYIWMVQAAGFPGDGGQAQQAWKRDAVQRFGAR